MLLGPVQERFEVLQSPLSLLIRALSRKPMFWLSMRTTEVSWAVSTGIAAHRAPFPVTPFYKRYTCKPNTVKVFCF